MLSLGGTLRYIPFAALHDGKGYLVERYATSIYTAAAQTDIKDKPKGRWRVAALGLSRAVEGFSALPSVPSELEGIVIGKGGSALKKVGTRARGRLEAFFGKKVFLETRVKVRPSWRTSDKALEDFGYL